MAMLTGSSTAEVDAPLGHVWALVEDVERAAVAGRAEGDACPRA
jgi:hypothetical protein